MTDDLLTIRQMCDRFGVTPRTLRFYESRELLFPERRGQHRLYDRRDRGRLTLILRGKRFGFSLEEIRALLDLYVPGERNREQVSAALLTARTHLEALRRQRDDLGLAIRDLEREIAAAEARLAETPEPASAPAPGTHGAASAPGPASTPL